MFVFLIILQFQYSENYQTIPQTESYVFRLTDGYSSTGPLEFLYYSQSLKAAESGDIENIEDKISKIRQYNPQSVYLPEMLYNLGILEFGEGDYLESKKHLIEVYNWSDVQLTNQMLPDVYYYMGRAEYELERYQESEKIFSTWLIRYEKGSQSRDDLIPDIYWWLGWSLFRQANIAETPQEKTSFYRKAADAFGKIQTDFQDTELFELNSELLEEMIDSCSANLG